jgi:hypothetical protein
MERWKCGLAVFLTVLVSLFLIVHYAMAEQIESMESISIDIGNFLIVYYCNVINSIVERRDFEIDKIQGLDYNIDINNSIDLKSTDFLKYLPRRIPYEPELRALSSSFQTEGKQECSTWYFRMTNMGIIRCLEGVRPLMHRLIGQALDKTGLDPQIRQIDHPVIHFRCADTPFIQNPDYKLRKHVYFRKALDFIHQRTGRKYDRLTILSYVKHRSTPEQQQLCQNYLGMLQTFLQEELGYQVDIQSKSNVEDFATMFYAPAVISTGGSYSLMSGFFGHGVFVQPQDYPLPEKVDWLLPDMNVEHGSVDYYDTAAVRNELYKT